MEGFEPVMPYRSIYTDIKSSFFMGAVGIGAATIAAGFATYMLTHNKKMTAAVAGMGLCAFGSKIYAVRRTQIAQEAQAAEQAREQAQQADQPVGYVNEAMIPSFDQWRNDCSELPSLTAKLRECVVPLKGICPSNTKITIDCFKQLTQYFIQQFDQLKQRQDMWQTPFSLGERPFYVQKVKAAEQETIYTHADLHGDVKSLMIFLQDLHTKGVIDQNWRVTPGNRIVFLGDYIDRGFYGLEVL